MTVDLAHQLNVGVSVITGRFGEHHEHGRYSHQPLSGPQRSGCLTLPGPNESQRALRHGDGDDGLNSLNTNSRMLSKDSDSEGRAPPVQRRCMGGHWRSADVIVACQPCSPHLYSGYGASMLQNSNYCITYPPTLRFEFTLILISYKVSTFYNTIISSFFCPNRLSTLVMAPG